MLHVANWLLAVATHDAWRDSFLGLDENQRFVVVLTALGCVTGVIITIVSIAYCWMDGVSKRRAEMDLKREMLDRGMSADEIAKVIEATPPSDAAQQWAAFMGPWGRRCGGKK
jgi:hypothetical protein